MLFLRAREGAAMRQFPVAQLVCEQSYKPFADELERGGLQVIADASASEARYPLVLVLPPRQREEARALFARAVALAAPGGIVVASITNNEGAKSGEADLKQLAGLGGSLTKHHCRVFWTRPLDGTHDAALHAQWSELDAPRPILDGRFLSRPGVFAWDRIDPASALLAGYFPADLAGAGADLGAGYGYLSAEILSRSAKVTSLDLYEAEARALDLAKRNLASFQCASSEKASDPRLSLARRNHWSTRAVRLHRQQPAVPYPEPRPTVPMSVAVSSRSLPNR